MKGDFTRITFDPRRHYRSVRMQQGRVQLDSDWNEQADLALHRHETLTVDVVGRSGGPMLDAAFTIHTKLTTIPPHQRPSFDAAFPGFNLASGDFVLGSGRYYVDGIRCEVEHPVPFSRQPHQGPLAPLSTSENHLVFLDVWDRHITALEEPGLRETALGGPDTTTRTQTIWQVRTLPVGTGSFTCSSVLQAYETLTARSTGAMRARAEPSSQAPKPCIVPPSAGYTGLENQLYRIEVHDEGVPLEPTSAAATFEASAIARQGALFSLTYSGGTWTAGQAIDVYPEDNPRLGVLTFVVSNNTSTRQLTVDGDLSIPGANEKYRLRPAAATFKWSRDNGHVVTRVVAVQGEKVTVDDVGPDEVLGFAAGQWVELTDEVTELEGRPGRLARVDDVQLGVVVLTAAPAPFPGDMVEASAKARGLKLRRWDGVGSVLAPPPAVADGFRDLEDGVEVRFETGTYHSGDYWVVPARTVSADEQSGRIEWPKTGSQPAALSSRGIVHHYARLGIITGSGGILSVQPEGDCRSLFPPTTALTTLVYVGGDGQEAMPGALLPGPLEVAVLNGSMFVAQSPISFTIHRDDGQPAGANEGELIDPITGATGQMLRMLTSGDGLASCRWRPERSPSLQTYVEARSLDPGGGLRPPVVRFRAGLSIAADVAYSPTDACPDLAGAKTVQEAIDTLCRRPSGQGCETVVQPSDDLGELLRQLSDQERSICLCLEPGIYPISGDFAVDKPVDLTVQSCSSQAVLSIEGPPHRLAFKGFREVRFSRLRIVARELDDSARLTFQSCDDVQLDHCTVAAPTSGGGATVLARDLRRLEIIACDLRLVRPNPSPPVVRPLDEMIHELARGESLAGVKALATVLAGDPDRRRAWLDELDTQGNIFAQLPPELHGLYDELRAVLPQDVEARPLGALITAIIRGHLLLDTSVALAIADIDEDIRLLNNVIYGDIFLGWPVVEPQSVGELDLTLVKEALTGNRIRFSAWGPRLQWHFNRCGRIRLSQEQRRLLIEAANGKTVDLNAVPGIAMLSGNEVHADNSLVVARHVALTTNELAAITPAAAMVVGRTAVVTGNNGDAPALDLLVAASDSATDNNLGMNVMT